MIVHLIHNAEEAIAQQQEREPGYAGRIGIVLGEAQIVIEDNGGGIDPAILERVCEPYFTTKFQAKGVGMGLFMVQSIVTEMEGSLWIENSDTGVRVTLKLPEQKN